MNDYNFLMFILCIIKNHKNTIDFYHQETRIPLNSCTPTTILNFVFLYLYNIIILGLCRQIIKQYTYI